MDATTVVANKCEVIVYMAMRGNTLITSYTFKSMAEAKRACARWNKECRAEGTPANHRPTARSAWVEIPQY